MPVSCASALSKQPKLRTLQVRRERKLEANLAKLRKLCIEVGADDAELAASVHPTLRNYAETMRGNYYSSTAKAAMEAGSTSEQHAVRVANHVSNLGTFTARYSKPGMWHGCMCSSGIATFH